MYFCVRGIDLASVYMIFFLLHLELFRQCGISYFSKIPILYRICFFCLFCLKVVYVTVTLPYILTFILLIRVLMLDGSVDGIVKFIKPDFSKLLTFQVCID
jgi:hypothetical protein